MPPPVRAWEERLGVRERTPEAFADLLAELGRAQGDDRLHLDGRLDAGDAALVWRIAR